MTEEIIEILDIFEKLPIGWTYSTLGQLVDSRGISYGIVQPGSHNSNGVPIIRVNNIKEGQFRIDEIMKVDKNIEEKYLRTRLMGGEVLLTLVGSLGECAIVPESMKNWNVARAIGVIPVKPEIGSRWIAFVLRSAPIQHYIKTWATTTVQATFNLRDVAILPIPLPPKSERDMISRILGSFDDKIEINRQMNETLEMMARAIFQSWFVDFDPVWAKVDGRDTWLPPEIAALFPDGFVAVDGREVPNGWGVEPLGNVIELGYGKALKQENRLSGKIPVYGSNGQIGWHDEKLVGGPGIIVGRKGNPGIIHWSATDFFPIDTTFFVILKGDIMSLYYLYHELQRQDLPSLSADSAVPGLNRNLVYMSKIIVPPQKILEKFDVLLKSLDQTIQNNDIQSRTLAQIRDALLPKLMSGELRVDNIDNNSS